MTSNVVLAANAAALPIGTLPTCVLYGTARHFGVPVAELTGDGRMREQVYRRAVGMYVARIGGASLCDIGRTFRRDYSTVHHALNRVELVRGGDAVEADLVGVEAAARTVAETLQADLRIRVADVMTGASRHFDLAAQKILAPVSPSELYVRRVVMAVAAECGHDRFAIARVLHASAETVGAVIEAFERHRNTPETLAALTGVRIHAVESALRFKQAFAGVTRHG